MADIEQMQMQVTNLKKQRDKIQGDIDKYQDMIAKLSEDKQKIQDQIDKISGVQEETDGAINTITAGNISRLDGAGNYAPKIGMVLSRKVKKNKKKKNENRAIDFLDNLIG